MLLLSKVLIFLYLLKSLSDYHFTGDTISLATSILLSFYLILLDGKSSSSRISKKNRALIYLHTFFPSAAFIITSSSLSIGANLLLFFLLLQIFTVANLGNLFHIEPFQAQVIKSSGMYALVRHPLYLINLFIFILMHLNFRTNLNFESFFLMTFYFILTISRIQIEEDFLIKHNERAYSLYVQNVKYKLIPGLI